MKLISQSFEFDNGVIVEFMKTHNGKGYSVLVHKNDEVLTERAAHTRYSPPTQRLARIIANPFLK